MTGTEREYNPWIITKHDISENLAEFIARRDDWNIDQIRNCPERVARLLAENRAIISGHYIYFVDFGGYFGYSCLVYLNEHQLRYATETERNHYGNIPRPELYRRYTDSMRKKLFTEEELCAPLKSYKECKRRETYLRNYLGDAENRISSFGIFNNEEVRRLHKRAVEGLYYSNITFSYYEDKAFTEKLSALYEGLYKAKQNTLDDYDYWKNAFMYEYKNHECIIGDGYDLVVSEMIRNGEFTDTQRKASEDAKQEYISWCYEHDIP